ncbi:sugar ABC transporter ATP-binding protein [Prescottella defluvii]|uniref:sugar ABC transporter ATP-binding protein n=1 Tax=Prescottella defluvii TaxID=1323361 RepID=UPI0009DF148D|nr:sugar ABC transporter ATP-binding protein [Prescottella defluvii]
MSPQDIDAAGSAGLSVAGVRKTYGGTTALAGLSFDVRPGEVRGLIGENGSGKSTAMKIISGQVVPDDGEVRVDGTLLGAGDAHARLTAGVGVVMQDPMLCEELSVAENLALGRVAHRGWVSMRRLEDRAAAVLSRAGLDLDPRARVGTLSQDDRHMVEVARVLAWDCKVVGFDETTASLTEDYVEKLFGVMRDLRARGAAQVFISHRIPEILTICDSVTVLRDGQFVTTVRCEDTSEAELIELLVGRKVEAQYRRDPAPVGDIALRTRDLEPAGLGGTVDLEVRAGEVVGIGGLVGSGRSEVLESIYGLIPRAGHVEVGGSEVPAQRPRQAIAAGLGLVPEDRRTRGLAMEASVRANAAAVQYGASNLAAPVRERELDSLMEVLRDQLQLKAPDQDAAVSTLSGGNQQKIVLGRWLVHNPRVLLLDEPTRGIDIGAKQDIYKLIDAAAHQGMAVLLVSSELPELIGLCDRILIMREGHLVAEFSGDVSEVELMSAAAGHRSAMPEAS